MLMAFEEALKGTAQFVENLVKIKVNLKESEQKLWLLVSRVKGAGSKQPELEEDDFEKKRLLAEKRRSRKQNLERLTEERCRKLDQ